MIFLQLFWTLLQDRPLRLRWRLWHAVAHTDGDRAPSSLALLGRLHQHRCHQSDDARAGGHQLSHLLRLYRRPQCRHGRHAGRAGLVLFHVCTRPAVLRVDDRHQQDVYEIHEDKSCATRLLGPAPHRRRTAGH